MSNIKRASAAQAAVEFHQQMQFSDPFEADKEGALWDILTNLRHLCAAHGISFKQAVEVSLAHFQNETKHQEE